MSQHNPLTLQIQLHYPEMAFPTKAHADDAGVDLTCMAVLPKGAGVFFLDTGISVEPPSGFYTELVPRSSICKTDFIMANSLGIIDHGYRGRLYMPMRYLGAGDGQTAAEELIGQRVGQLLLRRCEAFDIKVVAALGDTPRGAGGFGSSGT